MCVLASYSSDEVSKRQRVAGANSSSSSSHRARTGILRANPYTHPFWKTLRDPGEKYSAGISGFKSHVCLQFRIKHMRAAIFTDLQTQFVTFWHSLSLLVSRVEEVVYFTKIDRLQCCNNRNHDRPEMHCIPRNLVEYLTYNKLMKVIIIYQHWWQCQKLLLPSFWIGMNNDGKNMKKQSPNQIKLWGPFLGFVDTETVNGKTHEQKSFSTNQESLNSFGQK